MNFAWFFNGLSLALLASYAYLCTAHGARWLSRLLANESGFISQRSARAARKDAKAAHLFLAAYFALLAWGLFTFHHA